MRQYEKAIELHEEDKKIAEEVGDRAGVGRACANLCRCYAQDGKFDQARTYGNQYYQISRELQLRIDVYRQRTTWALCCALL